MTPRDLVALMDRTWPAHATRAAGCWQVREGRGGGRRVSSAVLAPGATAADAEAAIALAESAHQALAQPPVFRLLDGDEEGADAALAARGYRVAEPTILRHAAISPLADAPPERLTAFPLWPPLAITEEIWTDAGIGPGRRAIMALAPGPRTAILGRTGDRAAGAAFAAIAGDWVIVHALCVAPALRRQGLAQNLMRAAAVWGRDQGAAHIALAVARANTPANTLYDRLGLATAPGGYHYRTRE
ncbi:MAG: GNAT family N-acetyltransferase [Proteobacteria bacterium]|nr:GNAT family N-acetyltransferase [Pseudomonadota bacterium]MBS0572938.1 GNAT family N-acetyltransferase [Pseudomonadota bacterium]